MRLGSGRLRTAPEARRPTPGGVRASAAKVKYQGVA